MRPPRRPDSICEPESISARLHVARSSGSRARRQFLKAAAASGLLAAAARQAALAATARDYKALVCIFQQGGNDGENTLVRWDAAGYATYEAARPRASGINIPRRTLFPVQPRDGGEPLGLNPACAGFSELFERGALAIVANVGMLAEPTSRAALTQRAGARPANLFSHSDQQRALQSGDPRGVLQTGWGGRMADRLAPLNGSVLFPAAMATQLWGIFVDGAHSIPLNVPVGASTKPAITPDPGADALADAAMREIVGQRRVNAFDLAAQVYAREGLATGSVLTPILARARSAVRPFFDGLQSEIAHQLRNVALVIEAREQTGLRRQVFHVRHGNYDTHGGQAETHTRLLTDFSRALTAFHAAMREIGVGRGVTTFTLSDFGRTLRPAANNGTDHGWGNCAFVLGDDVRGGRVHGKLADPSLGGPDDFGNAGRWIPTTSLEQYAAALVRWFGVPEADLPYVLPNIRRFPGPGLRLMAT